jgi:hypothetical protein
MEVTRSSELHVATHNIVRVMVTGVRTSNPTKIRDSLKKEKKKTFYIK